MSDTTISFTVPENPLEVAIAIADAGGTIDGFEEADSADAIAEYLAARAGQLEDAMFDEPDNPYDAVHDVMRALGDTPGPYFGYWPSHTERSRGDRYQGGYVYLIGPEIGATEKQMPWQDGEPDPTDRTMRLAGIPDDHLWAILETFFERGKTPAPKGR